ncbi:MAG TPA: hypothetical protein PLH80_11860 [Spirochaetota bacterium]|nr:hypothetical protein [Spirochaetota bacterium]HPD06014.1 hypothetical protein [Spirochaetota bacterium]HQG43841.1 hypothetical protein [Spirochaetota bacterium]HQI39248.1 hypothetical protein [Spirochaetota bacterium]HRR62053.1 hypothetical protein [Spirochaetota bacterium]
MVLHALENNLPGIKFDQHSDGIHVIITVPSIPPGSKKFTQINTTIKKNYPLFNVIKFKYLQAMAKTTSH